jgi:hypothetical protein
VWLEAGSRLGQTNVANPLFVCPSARFTSLLGPIGNQKALNLDNESELVELINAAGKILQRTPRDFLSYRPALSDLTDLAKREYSVARERQAAVGSWARRHSPTLALAVLILVLGLWYVRWSERVAQEARENDDIQRNSDAEDIVSRFLILTGTVVSQSDNQAVPEALVIASKSQELKAQAGCDEPQCTFGTTDTDGKFSIDLTKIRAKEDETITLIVTKEGFTPNRKLIRIDVRAMDATVAPQSVRLSAPASPPGLTGSSQ